MIQARLTLGLFGPDDAMVEFMNSMSPESANFHHIVLVKDERHLRGRMFDGYILLRGYTTEDLALMQCPEAALRLKEK